MSTARTSLARTVAILCGNPDFQRFLSERFPRARSESGTSATRTALQQ